jgi:16S rRNA (cytosine1402-N4)-methyltransferase
VTTIQKSKNLNGVNVSYSTNTDCNSQFTEQSVPHKLLTQLLMTEDKYCHIPVMCKEVIENLRLKSGNTVVDCTIGCGGYAQAILKEIGPKGKLIGLDRDRQALAIAEDRLTRFSNCVFIQDNFRNINQIFEKLEITRVDGMVFDLGVSSLQLETAERGFSMRLDAPLDMRMDRNLRLSAFDLVNFLPEVSLSEILKKYGQERWHNRIARAIVKERKNSMIVSTKQLADLVKRITPVRHAKIHPATRTFQALRIAVNDELEALREGLHKVVNYLNPGARICIVSFHSLEDRIVKHQFRTWAQEGKFKIITKKPITPTKEEISQNPRARSAKLRVAEKAESSEQSTKGREI